MENNQNLLTFGELYQTYKERFLRLAISYVNKNGNWISRLARWRPVIHKKFSLKKYSNL